MGQGEEDVQEDTRTGSKKGTGRTQSRLQRENGVPEGASHRDWAGGLDGQSCLQRALLICTQSQGRALEFHTAIQRLGAVGRKRGLCPGDPDAL